MIWLLLALQLPSTVEQGSKLFAKSCATGYCHGAEGAAARGPRLRDRQFDRAYLLKVTRDGIPGSAMPAWKDRFSPAEVEAVVNYIVHLNGGKVDPVQPAGPSPKADSAAPGRQLYQDQCAACHQGKGLNLTAKSIWPPSGKALQLKLQDGETFPAHLVSESDGLTIVLDLTDNPPIRRSLETVEIASRGPFAWNHPAANPEDWAKIRAWLMLPLR